MKKLYNLTGHPINVSGIDIPHHGSVRLAQTSREVGEIETEFGTIKLGQVEFLGAILPKQREDTILIVGVVVAQAFPERGDLYIPRGKGQDNTRKGIQKNPFYIAK